MCAYSLVRSARLVKQKLPSIYTPKIYLRGFSNATVLAKIAADKVPVSTYNGNRERSTLHVDQGQSPQVVVPSDDMTRKAMRFDRSLLPRLNHTMAQFTLVGKVAVVTG